MKLLLQEMAMWTVGTLPTAEKRLKKITFKKNLKHTFP